MEFSENELNEVLSIFRSESLEILEAMDGKLLLLEKDPDNNELVLELFREAHSVKGSCRMLGFEALQNLVHKIEDIFGYFRDFKLKPNSDNLESISKTLIYIRNLIEKTVENKSEYSDDLYSYYLDLITNILDSKDEVIPSYNKESKTSEDIANCEIYNNSWDFIYEIILNYSLIKKFSNIGYIKKISKQASSLLEVSKFMHIENFEKTISETLTIVKIIEDKKYNNINDAFEDLLLLDKQISEVVNLYSNFCLKNKIPLRDFYEKVFDDINNYKEIKTISKSKISDVISLLIQDIQLIRNNPNIIDNVINGFKKIVFAIGKHKDTSFFKIFSDIFELYKNEDKILEKDTTDAICDILKSYTKTPAQKRTKELDTFIQRAEIIYNIAQINLKNKNNKKELAEIQTDNSQDWLSNLDTSSIKTLRVDSAKLDMLVNGIGELIVTRIKNGEQVNFARKIQGDFLDWQKSWHKLGHFMKYFDRKYLSAVTNPYDAYQSAVLYNKQLISLYASHTNKLHSIFSELDKLYQSMQEQETGLNTITNELETMVKNMRILPLATIFHIFPRMVHNIAKENGKNIEFKIQGSEVSADKKIIEDIKIPIMHILRNAIDHGIESPEERRAIGKPETGIIIVEAEHREDKIIISIKDDGRGLDIQKIKEKAIEKGFLTQLEAETLPSEELANLVYCPGFSTETTVTELSGRGLGLDIVHTKISQLNGRIDISSQYNVGTIVTIELPATMATIKSFVALECDTLFAFPATSIKTVVRISTEEVFSKDNKNYYAFGEKIIPVYTLSQILGYENIPRVEEKYTLLIIESDNSQIGIIVQKLIGEEEILFKKLPDPLHKIKNIAGVTTLANGTSCLILNMTDIMSKSDKKNEVNILVSNSRTRYEDNKNFEILVVDDSRVVMLLEKNIIEAQGYKVRIATNAVDALDIMDKKKFDLVITDNQMPKMSGYDFVQEVRKNIAYKDTPILILTSHNKQEWWPKFQKIGANAYIQKSEFNQEYFVNTINELLNESK